MSTLPFGLDIGRSLIKVVQLEKGSNKRVLVAAGNTPTPAGGIQSESQTDIKKISESIKVVMKAAQVEGNKCSIALIESQVVTRVIQMPNLTDKELSAAINWEAEKYVPLPIKDVNLRYKVISRPAYDTQGKMDVLIVGAPKRLIEKYLDIVKGAGCEVASLETESIALSKSLTLSTDPSTMIASFGALSTELVLVDTSNIVFTRSIAAGGITLTKAIMAEFNLSINQAEDYKQAYGLSQEALSGKVAMVIRPIIEIVVSEITKAIDFFKIHYNHKQVARIIICGGGAFLPGLPQFLTDHTGLEVSLGDPWANFSKEGLILELPGQGIFYSIATGLAIGE